ncbi:VirD4-like conjugal transfer protein, CD1115 family [Acetoanaerobium noterae]|uniref:VirD4-like conjugal transfer protein, CD1115 family n=1 Tax=Acetoanaerobium noterae TaxID=745369 RepID=UPI003AB95C04
MLPAVKNDIANSLAHADMKKAISSSIPYLLIFFISNKISYLSRVNGKGIFDAILNFQDAFTSLLLSFNSKDLLNGILATGVFFMIIYLRKLDKKKFRKGQEYGSARWGTKKEIIPYIDLIPRKNIILTETEKLTLSPYAVPNQPHHTARNKNILVVGDSGSGKTRFFVKPNIMQMHSSYVVTDPKGTVLLEVGKMLSKGRIKQDAQGRTVTKDNKPVYEPYKIKVLNTINFKKSMHYNPFAYLKKEKDILKLVNTIILNTKGEGEKAAEDFWVKAERLLYTALIAYIFYESPEEEKNFNTLISMIDSSEVHEDDESFVNGVDVLFKELETGKDYLTGEVIGNPQPNHFAVRQYKKYKLAAGKTAKSILISCGARLAPFDIEELKEMLSDDKLELDKLGDKLTALFIIISDTDTTFNFIVAMLYTQLFNLLCEKADDEYGGKLPYHVRCLLDEFANIGQIPNFEKLIATIRSREISASVVLQSKSQLKAIYKDHANTIEGNCDTTLFLGGKEKDTLKDLAEILGKETIDLYNTSENRGQQQSYGMNYQKVGKDLMSQDEIAILDGGKCIMQLRGVRPFLSKKYDISKHENYIMLSDYDKKNSFDVEKYIKYERVETKRNNIRKTEYDIGATSTKQFDNYIKKI